MDSSAFKKFSNSREVQKAISIYQNTAFTDIQAKAQQGDRQAQLYLINLSLPVIISVFARSYARRNRDSDIYFDGAYEYLANVIAHLIEITKEHKGPFFTFDATRYPNTSNSFLTDKFRYYMMRTAEHVARKMNQENYEKDVPVSDTEGSNEDGYEDKIASMPDPLRSGEATNNTIEDNDVYDRFEQVLRNKAKSNVLLIVYKYIRQGMSMGDIADELGVSRQYVHQIVTKIKNIYQKTKEVA